jgi:hypothetical protein
MKESGGGNGIVYTRARVDCRYGMLVRFISIGGCEHARGTFWCFGGEEGLWIEVVISCKSLLCHNCLSGGSV